MLYDIFITHAWRYHDDWVRVSELLDGVAGLRWRNFSVPWHDPAMDPNTQVGGQFIRDWLESQIVPAHAVILLGSVYAIKSARKWLDLELEMARRLGKPVLGLPPVGASAAPEWSALCDEIIAWDGAEIFRAIERRLVVK